MKAKNSKAVNKSDEMNKKLKSTNPSTKEKARGYLDAKEYSKMGWNVDNLLILNSGKSYKNGIEAYKKDTYKPMSKSAVRKQTKTNKRSK